jgi:hypothetical protein
MDITSTIAAASIYMYQSQTQQSVDTAMMKKAMDVQEAAATDLIQSLSETLPSFGYKLDIKV